MPVRKRPRTECDGCGESAEESVGNWIQRNQLTVVTIKVGKAKDGAIPFGTSGVKETLEVSESGDWVGLRTVADSRARSTQLLVDQANYPIYIHDLDGSDVLAMMCAALRKLQGWSEPAWTTEMSRSVQSRDPLQHRRKRPSCSDQSLI